MDRTRRGSVMTTARLKLRQWRDDDVEPFAAMNADPHVREFFPDTLTSEESARSVQYVQDHFVAYGFGLWAVEVIGGAPFIGFIGLAIPSFEAPFTPCVEIGWRLAFEHWGRGYAVEGAREALTFGFESQRLKEIVSFTTVDNVRSRRVMDRIGMRHDSRDDFEHPNIAAGHPLRRHVLYRLPRKDWHRGR